MNPYRTLGVPRGCTREEAKEAFRARVQSVFPDRDAEGVTLIQIRAAYNRILVILDRRARRRPHTQGRALAPRTVGAAKSPAPTADLGRTVREAAADVEAPVDAPIRWWPRMPISPGFIASQTPPSGPVPQGNRRRENC